MTRVSAGQLTGTERAGGWTDTWQTSITGTVTKPPADHTQSGSEYQKLLDATSVTVRTLDLRS